MIIFLLLILILFGAMLGLISYISIIYYFENKIWNNGICASCNSSWQKVKPEKNIPLYECCCNTIYFKVKQIIYQ